MTRKTSKREKGITLIALIVTIIVLLILAGVTINLAVNNQGIFNKAKTATGAYKNASEGERTGLDEADKEIAKYMPKEGSEGGSGSESGGGTSGGGSITYTDSAGKTQPLTKGTPAGTEIGTTANIDGQTLNWYLFDVSDDGKTAYLVSTPTYWVPDTTKEVSGAWVPRLVDEPDKEIQVSYMPNATYTISHLVSTTTFDERNKEKTNGAKLQKLVGYIDSKTHAMSQAIQKLKNGTSGYSPSSVTYKPSSKTLNYFKSVNSQWSEHRGNIDLEKDEFKTKLNENEQAACYLADEDIFAGIKDQVNKADGNLKGRIQTLVGGASAEQWCKAYNNQAEVKNDTTKEITCGYSTEDAPGYIYKVNGTAQNSGWYTNTNTIFGNDIYGPANKNSDSSNPFYSDWWLASPSSYSSDYMCTVSGGDSSLNIARSSNCHGWVSLFASVAL